MTFRGREFAANATVDRDLALQLQMLVAGHQGNREVLALADEVAVIRQRLKHARKADAPKEELESAQRIGRDGKYALANDAGKPQQIYRSALECAEKEGGDDAAIS